MMRSSRQVEKWGEEHSKQWNIRYPETGEIRVCLMIRRKVRGLSGKHREKEVANEVRETGKRLCPVGP